MSLPFYLRKFHKVATLKQATFIIIHISLKILEIYQLITLFLAKAIFGTNICNSYLPGWEVNRDHEGGSSRARPFHCTSVGLTPAISPNVGNSTA